jgi:hypothetical protein
MFASYKTMLAFVLSVALVMVTLAVYCVKNFSALRWRVSSRSYKAKVLGQPASANAEFKHVEWDGWGWAGQDTTVYLVFDPKFALGGVQKP